MTGFPFSSRSDDDLAADREPASLSVLDDPSGTPAADAGDLPDDVVAPVERPAGLPPSPVARERSRTAATRLFVALLAVLVVVAAVFTVVLLAGGGTSTATGFVQPTAASYLDFARSGTVSNVLVKPGDRVRAGQVLAEQGGSELQAKLAADQATLYSDEARALEVGGGGSSAHAQAAGLVAQANGQLAAARARVADSLTGAQGAVATAQQRLQAAQSAYAQAQASYAAQVAACGASGRTSSSTPSDAECAQVKATLANDSGAVDNAAAALAQAQQAEQTAQSSADQQTAVANAAAALSAANSAEASPGSPADVANANAAVSRDIAAVAADQAAVAGAQILAPVDGVVGTVGAQAGDYATPEGVRAYLPATSSGGSQGFTLFGSPPSASTAATGGSQLQPVVVVYSTTMKVTAQVGEGQIATVSVGRHASVSVPAVHRSVGAAVSAVNPSAISRGGKVYYLVELTLSDSSPAGVLPGMTADVSFD